MRRPSDFGFIGLMVLLVSLLGVGSGRVFLPVSHGQTTNELDLREQELDDLRYRIESVRKRARALSQDEKQQLAHLKELEMEAALTRELLEGLQQKEQRLQSQIDTLQAGIEETQGRIDARQVQLAQRLRAMYMRPRQTFLAAALESERLSELSQKIRMLTHIARAEQALIDEVKQDQMALHLQSLELKSQIAEVHLTRSEAEDRRIALERLQAERETSVSDLRQQKDRFEASVREMEQAARSMETLIGELDAQEGSSASTGAESFASRMGSLPWPLRGPILRPYGRSIHPEFKTTVMNKGVNIGATVGAPIRAVAAGVVDFVDWLPGYGRCVIVNHGDGYYTLYAHASVLHPSEGEPVEAGEVIGEVGDSGSLNGSQLYFEIRRGRESLDPAEWLSR